MLTPRSLSLVLLLATTAVNGFVASVGPSRASALHSTAFVSKEVDLELTREVIMKHTEEYSKGKAATSIEERMEIEGKETLLDRLGGEPALEAAVDIFYDRVVADEQLAPFFQNSDMKSLRSHQYKFMEIAFTHIPEELDVGKYISDAHKQMMQKQGLNELHFDLVAGHLVGTLQGLGVSSENIDEVVATVGPLRAVFEKEE